MAPVVGLVASAHLACRLLRPRIGLGRDRAPFVKADDTRGGQGGSVRSNHGPLLCSIRIDDRTLHKPGPLAFSAQTLVVQPRVELARRVGVPQAPQGLQCSAFPKSAEGRFRFGRRCWLKNSA
jgi:hypothetical protein